MTMGPEQWHSRTKHYHYLSGCSGLLVVARYTQDLQEDADRLYRLPLALSVQAHGAENGQ
jgi:hypothetical protein